MNLLINHLYIILHSLVNYLIYVIVNKLLFMILLLCVYTDRIVWISIAILICLFMVQRFGTDKVGYTFAPIICVWFTLIGGIGVYNFIKFDPTVVKALNPQYIVDYFRRNKKDAWISLGGIVLAITGSNLIYFFFSNNT